MAQTSPFFKLVSTFNCTKQLLAFSIPFLTILVAINIVRSVQKKISSSNAKCNYADHSWREISFAELC